MYSVFIKLTKTSISVTIGRNVAKGALNGFFSATSEGRLWDL